MGLRLMGVPLLACLFSTLLHAEVTSAAAETVKVSTTPIFPQIPWGQTKKKFQVLVSVEAPPATEKTRLPIDLVVVIDVSGGMEKPLRLDLVKKAMDQFVIWQLHDEDRIAFVGPTNSVDQQSLLGISGDGRKNARQKVAELKSRTCYTEFPSHLQKVVQILDGRPADSWNRAGFIILLTDGKGISEIPGGLNKYPVHTLGLSAAHDPKALFSIAQKSRGTYSFVADDALHEITGALAFCLGGLKNVVALGTRVLLKTAEPSAVTIEGIESGGYERSNDKTSGEIKIGALYAGEVKNFIVRLDVGGAQSLDGDCDLQKLLTVSVSYNSGTEVTGPISNVVCIQRPQGVDAVQKFPFPEVVNHIVRFELLQIVANFVVQNELGSPDLGNKLQRAWEEFVQVHQFWSCLDVLGGLEVEVNAMVSILKQGGSSGVAHIYSWLSSYQMQRPTAMGSPGKVVAVFVTPVVGWNCPEAHDQCVDTLPPKFLQSGLGSNTYNLTSAYPEIWIEAINQVISQMYLAVLKASNLSQCGVETHALE